MILQYFSRHISFSRTFQESSSYSSTFQACANPGKVGCHGGHSACWKMLRIISVQSLTLKAIIAAKKCTTPCRSRGGLTLRGLESLEWIHRQTVKSQMKRSMTHRGSYMRAHVLLNLLNMLGKRDKM